MAVNAISMRRLILGEGSFVESLVGRVLILVLFTSLVGSVLALLFLVNRLEMPVLLKFGVLAATGVSAGFGARRLLVGRSFLLRLGAAIFALFIALGLLNVITFGYLGLNLLRAYPNNPQWDGALQLVIASGLAALSIRAWRVTVREVMVEPRYSPPSTPRPASRPARHSTTRSMRRTSSASTRRRPPTSRTSAASASAAFSAWSSRITAQFRNYFLAPSTGTASRGRTAKKTTRSKRNRQRVFRRQPAVYLSSEVEHRCPYCLEEVRRNDPRGIKICKVCKTWHHADCWAITGVCQVPHEYVN
jgi:hypothetical protein